MSNMNEETLGKVAGGRGYVFERASADPKEKEFETAWTELNMDAKGLTGTELEDLYAQWQKAGYTPDARTFLTSCKTI